MPKSAKPRKKYRPKVPPDFIQIPSVFRYAPKHETNLQLVPHAELEKFRRGLADEYSYNTLAFRLNWGYVMADDFAEPEARAVMESALAAVRSVKERHERLGKWGMAGDEFARVGDGLNLTDEMQKATTRKEQNQAMQTMLAVNEYKQREGMQ